MSTSQYPAGYYADPSGTASRRWWTGSEWGELETDQPAPTPPEPVLEPLPPAGYYADPENPLRQRYWDGAAWGAPEPAAIPLVADPASIYDPVPRSDAPASQPAFDVSTQPRPRRLSRPASPVTPIPAVLDRYSNEDHTTPSSLLSRIPALSNLRIPSMRTLVIGCLVVILVVIGIGVATKKPSTATATFCTDMATLSTGPGVNLSFTTIYSATPAQMRAARARLISATRQNITGSSTSKQDAAVALSSAPPGIIATTIQEYSTALNAMLPLFTEQLALYNKLPATPSAAELNAAQHRYETAINHEATVGFSAVLNKTFLAAYEQACPTSATTTTTTLP